METFWESCGAHGPLILEVEADGDRRTVRHVFDRPFVLIGSGSRSDLLLDHQNVSRRHAYVQVISGKPYCLDLDSRTGTHQDVEGETNGCLAADRPVRIGPFSVRARVESVTARGPEVVQNPLAVPDAWLDPCPRPTLDFQLQGGPTTVTIGRTLSLIGRSERCKIRIKTPEASRFLVSLLRTPGGTWAIDLRSSDRLSVNGSCMDYARLKEGDELQIGSLMVHVRVPSASSAIVPAPATSDLSTADIRAILDQVANLQHHSNDQFRQVILMVAELFGSMHRETMDLVREELEQIRILAGELKAFREESAWGQAVETTRGSFEDKRASLTDHSDAGGTPRDPGEIHLIVSERLAAFEHERRGRWNTLSKILNKAGA